MTSVSPRDQRQDSHLAEPAAMRLGIVPSVRNQNIRLPSRTATFAANRRNGFDERYELRHVVSVGSGDQNRERNPVAVRDQMMLAAGFPPVRGIRTDLRPPMSALTEDESATARFHSILPASFNFASITLWTFCQTPAFCQSRR